ncbi:DUF2628 domain-containing protein [Candidatus Finniella inopinata]|nr:DUF2628 domain-containing protein [Candidatus Finniella inopinata]
MDDQINIQNLMKLSATGNPTRNSYYEETFRKMLSGQKYVWNWSAALFGPVWLVYRRSYGSAFFLMPLLTFVSIWYAALLGLAWLVYRKSYGFSSLGMPVFLALYVLPLFALLLVNALILACQKAGLYLLCPIVIAAGCCILFQGYMGNGFYVWSLKRKISKGYHRAPKVNIDMLSAIFLASILISAFTCVGFFLTHLAILAKYV